MTTTKSIEPLFSEVINIYNNYAMGFINRFEAVCQVTDAINQNVEFGKEYEECPKVLVTFVEGLFRLNGTLWAEKVRGMYFKSKLDAYAWVACHLIRYKNLVEQVYEWSKVDGVVKPTDQIDEKGVHAFAYGVMVSENSRFGLFVDYTEADECISEIMG